MLVSKLKGIGEKRAKYLKEVGVVTTHDLVRYLPVRYIDMRQVRSVLEARGGEYILLKGFASKPKVAYPRRDFSISTFKIETKEGAINAICYNRPYLSTQIKIDEEYLFFGIVSSNKGIKIVNPIIDSASNPKKLFGIMSVYRKVESVPDLLMRSLIEQSLAVEGQNAVFNEDFSATFRLNSYKSAYAQAHKPATLEQAEQAKRDIAVYEGISLMHAYRLLKENSMGERKRFYTNHSAQLAKLESQLPFSLSPSQKTALADIYADLSKSTCMNRMICGDVGSGKTLVAMFAMYNAVLNGYQSALMSPTEVLARQHYKTAIKLFGNTLRIGYYSAGLSKADKDSVLFDIRNGVYDIIIGTHALFQPNVRYKNLALVVTDEVHRFGVAQRNALENKGETDVLVMSATPLPRTLALIYYSDLDVSYLQYPIERANNISTAFVPSHKINDMYTFLKKSDKQAYIICPRIFGDEDDDSMVSAVKLHDELAKGALKGVPIGLLHGRMTDEEKNRVVTAFASGDIKVLVSTTVVEVGIDVSNAESIVIFGAERFGLCQLHQLRGRVGRDGSKAYCFLITDTENQDSLNRLSVLKECNDAFRLAEHDLEARGAGDLVGMRQSGFGDIFFQTGNAQQIKRAREIVEDINANFPHIRSALTILAYEIYGESIFKSTLN